jgi:hypothetical protein
MLVECITFEYFVLSKAKAAVDGLRAELSRAQSQLKAAEKALAQVEYTLAQTYPNVSMFVLLDEFVDEQVNK